MVRVNFRLTDKKADVTNIYAEINYGLYTIVERGKGKGKNKDRKYLQLKYTTPVSVPVALWNAKDVRVEYGDQLASVDAQIEGTYSSIKSSAKKNQSEMNSNLLEFRLHVERIVNDLTVDGRLPIRERVKVELDRIYNPDRIEESSVDGNRDFSDMNLVQFIDHMIETLSNLKESTIKSYKVVRKNIAEYQTKYKTVVTPLTADEDFYHSFVKYLTAEGLAKNTIGTRIKIVKTVLNYASEKKGVKYSDDFRKKSFAKPSEETESIYLNVDELNAIDALVLLPKSLDKVRDMFLIASDTGLRYSDVIRLTAENITEEGLIKIQTQKTGKTIYAPVTPRVKRIFKKYDYKLPKPISNQKYNQFIKDIAKMAGITAPVTRTHTTAGKLTTTTLPKYELVTSHTARRSFATNAYIADVPTLDIMKVTGHKTEVAFLKYIRISAEESAKKMSHHQFFNQLTVVKSM
ncbi:tyrosine-type recombinase/integrase [Proteiniphilum propionicum]|uniref:tyrosine-type recombinase/integrase n=1 Tax=Proteiniphilum propionicum TaxID=2829812 RepID=UPI001EEAFDA9|nr:site-specific integrase [Proteiniphilum propionicum]ULB33916.1 phage integrase SAM-like domain-containing protein [Proteiniphilum propionicum]